MTVFSEAEYATFWTLAYRKPGANHYQRMTDWCGTWEAAERMATRFGLRNPDVEVWYVASQTAEEAGYVHAEDIGNVLTLTDRRVRMMETGTITRGMSPDDIVTTVTEATDREAAEKIINNVPRTMLMRVADLLYIEADGHGLAWLRKAIVSEARA